MSKHKTVVLGVCGGIACYKIAALASKLAKHDYEVPVIMTQNATEFITPLTFETLTKQHCILSTFERPEKREVQHIALAQKADLFVIAPATANVIAKLAHGLADDMLTTTALAATCKKMVFPSMNAAMYDNPITQHNLALLRQYGFTVFEPEIGRLACQDIGKGRLPEPDYIYGQIEQALAEPKDWKGIRLLVTAGPTQEPIDPVRFISNHSTGKMGYAVAQAAAERGATVCLVSGPTALQKPKDVFSVDVVTADEMYDAVVGLAPSFDVIVKTAAVADFRPAETQREKIKKQDAKPALELVKNKDILAQLGMQKPAGQILCGFSMETEHMVENSRVKLEQKNLDLIVANNLNQKGAGFGGDTNIVTVITQNDQMAFEQMSKRELADRLLDIILALRS